MEGLCQAAVEGLCGPPWYDWIVPRTSGDVAQWVGALFTALAVVVAAFTYAYDRILHRRAQRLSAWVQANLIVGHLGLAMSKLAALNADIFQERSVYFTNVPGKNCIIDEVDPIFGLLTDVSAFDVDVAARLLRFLGQVRMHNTVMRHACSVHNIPIESPTKRPWPEEIIRGWVDMQHQAATLVDDTRKVVDIGPRALGVRIWRAIRTKFSG